MFPVWLSHLRGLVNFLRIDSHRQKLVLAVEEQGLDSGIVKNKPPGFAQWRWDTLADASEWVERAHMPLVLAMTSDMFKG